MYIGHEMLQNVKLIKTQNVLNVSNYTEKKKVRRERAEKF